MDEEEGGMIPKPKYIYQYKKRLWDPSIELNPEGGSMIPKKPEKKLLYEQQDNLRIYKLENTSYNQAIDDYEEYLEAFLPKVEEIREILFTIITDKGLGCKYCGVDYLRIEYAAKELAERLGVNNATTNSKE